ncbi:FAD/NAD(P)-binding domain-containing protein, partial [Gymnopus androsaceus JB14]
GGGIGGLTCAAALKDCHDIEIDLFEAAAKFVAIGAGIVTWPRTHACFKALGVNEEVLEAVLNTRKECKETEPTNLHRQKLLDLLLSQLPSASHCRIHFGHRLAGCRELPDSVELCFRNGAIGSFDLVIGADGLKSVVRQAVVRGHGIQGTAKSDILYTGQSAFRALIPRERLVEVWPDHRALHTPTIYCGKSKHLVAYPIQNGEIVNLVAFFSDSRSGSPVIESASSSGVPVEAILATYPGWHDEAVELLKMMKDPTIWPIQDLRPLETYVTPRIALLGDAAHAMSPHLGAGACTAIEDAYILGKIIAKSAQGVTNSNDIHQMLDIYNTLRQPYGNEIMRWAHEMGEFYEF